MRINNEDLLTSGPVDMSDSFELKPVWLGHIVNYSIQMVFTGSPDGTFKLQASDDPGHPDSPIKSQQYMDVDNWTDISGSEQVITEAGDHTYQVQEAGYVWVRVVWTDNGGTGSLVSAVANTKGV